MFLDVWCSWARAGALTATGQTCSNGRIVHRVRNTSFTRAASGAVQVQAAEVTSKSF